MHLLTVGMSPGLVRDLWDRVAARSGYRISHLMHPGFDRRADSGAGNWHYFRDDIRMPLPPGDAALLASLERPGVPTIHNMIMSDRLVARIPHDDAIAYATLLAQRLMALYGEIGPTAIIGGFDALHGSLGFAVARRMGIPWFVLYFSSIPPGQVAFCTDLTPASMLPLQARSRAEMRADAERLLRDFEVRKVQAAAYIPPRLFSLGFVLRQVPTQLRSLATVLSRRRDSRFLRYTDNYNSYSLGGLFHEALRLRANLWRLHRKRLTLQAPTQPYAFFGLHTQPESSIDVFAHFFSNQLRVIELMARSLPPTHKLLVKLHKSDAPNYSLRQLAAMSAFPGVELVSPYADTYELIKNADLVFTIQGTIGMEAAMLGKPVIMFGESVITRFPSVAMVGRTIDLPALVRQKLVETRPERAEIIAALADYLVPFYPASGNDWTIVPSDAEIDGYVKLFRLLEQYCAAATDERHARDGTRIEAGESRA